MMESGRGANLSRKDLDFMLSGGQDGFNQGTANFAGASCDRNDYHFF